MMIAKDQDDEGGESLTLLLLAVALTSQTWRLLDSVLSVFTVSFVGKLFKSCGGPRQPCARIPRHACLAFVECTATHILLRITLYDKLEHFLNDFLIESRPLTISLLPSLSLSVSLSIGTTSTLQISLCSRKVQQFC